MARNQKEGLDYFPLDTDFFTNKKIKNLRRAHGAIGVLTYLNLLSRVYKNGYYYKFDDLEELSMDIAEEIAYVQLRATATSVTETINYLVGREILDEGLFKQGIISGVALQEQYVKIAYKAKRIIKMDVYCLIDVSLFVPQKSISSEETPISSEETPISSEEIQQSKSKSKNKDISNDISKNISLCADSQGEVVTGGDKVSPRFVKPTVDEIEEYCRKRNNKIDAEEFFHHYESNGWKVGKTPMKSWKSAVITWEKKRKAGGDVENGRFVETKGRNESDRPTNEPKFKVNGVLHV